MLTSGQAEVPHSLPLEPDSPLAQNPKREATGKLKAICTAPLVCVLCLATSPPLESQQPDAHALALLVQSLVPRRGSLAIHGPKQSQAGLSKHPQACLKRLEGGDFHRL